MEVSGFLWFERAPMRAGSSATIEEEPVFCGKNLVRIQRLLAETHTGPMRRSVAYPPSTGFRMVRAETYWPDRSRHRTFPLRAFIAHQKGATWLTTSRSSLIAL